MHNGPLPGAPLDYATMPGHWLLARMGKRVLRTPPARGGDAQGLQEALCAVALVARKPSLH